MDRNSSSVVRVDGSILAFGNEPAASHNHKRTITAYLREMRGVVAKIIAQYLLGERPALISVAKSVLKQLKDLAKVQLTMRVVYDDAFAVGWDLFLRVPMPQGFVFEEDNLLWPRVSPVEEEFALPDASSTAQDAHALNWVHCEVIECEDLVLAAKEGCTEVQDLEVSGRILPCKIVCRRGEGTPRARPTLRLPVIERQDDIQGQAIRCSEVNPCEFITDTGFEIVESLPLIWIRLFIVPRCLGLTLLFFRFDEYERELPELHELVEFS